MSEPDSSGSSAADRTIGSAPDARKAEAPPAVTVEDLRVALSELWDGRPPARVIPVATPLGSEAPLWELIAAPDDVAAEAIERVVIDQARDVVALLHGQERLVLETLFGLDGRPPRSTREAAQELGISPAWLRKIEGRAMAKMRAMLGA